MDNTITNQNPTFTSNNSTWNLEKMEHILHDHQLGMGSVWPNYTLQMHQTPSTSSSSATVVPSSSTSSSSFLINDILGIQLEEEEEEEEPEEELGAMKEMMYKIAAMQPVDIDPATIRKPKRRNVRISDDPQSVAARHRRERISEKIRILQRLVPGGTKMDTASMLDEAIRYVKFLKRQIRLLQSTPHSPRAHPRGSNINATTPFSGWPFAPPSMMHSSTISSSMDTPAAGFGFNAGDGSGFNHEVISD